MAVRLLICDPNKLARLHLEALPKGLDPTGARSAEKHVLAKVGAIATILFGFSFLPQVVLFVGQMLVSDAALDAMRDGGST